jgi:hypothetical protein
MDRESGMWVPASAHRGGDHEYSEGEEEAGEGEENANGESRGRAQEAVAA